MGNGRKRRCAALTKSGDRCSRRAAKGSKVCGLKGHVVPKPKAKAKRKTKAKDSRDPPAKLELEYAALAEKCVTEMDAESKSAIKVQWMRLLIDCVKLLKAEGVDAQRPLIIQLAATLPEPDGPRPT
jgi:hypothetical protein